jgi:hypothetical protein
MKIRFQADADFNHRVVKGARRREPALDFQSASDAGLIGLDDPEVLSNGRARRSHPG